MVFLIQKKKSRSYKSYGKYFMKKSDDVFESARNV